MGVYCRQFVKGHFHIARFHILLLSGVLAKKGYSRGLVLESIESGVAFLYN